MHTGSEICRTCLCTENTTVFSLDATVPNSDFMSIKEKLSFCVPEINLDIIPNAVICAVCSTALHTSFLFKNRCQKIEERLQNHLNKLETNTITIDLRQIVDAGISSKTVLFTEEAQHNAIIIKKETCETSNEDISEVVKVEPVDYVDDAELEDDSLPDDVQDTALANIGKPHKCNICKKSYKRETSLILHMTIHKLSESHQNDNLIIDPENSDGKVKQFLPKSNDNNVDSECEICQKRFYSKSNLSVHMRIHTGEKPYKCGVCEKAFTQKVYLTAHQRTHTGEKPFKCTLCNKSFAQKSYLRTHMIVHTGVRHHICKICGKGCAHTGDLNNHMRIHTGEKPYKCNDCGKCFTQSVHLKSHFKIHSGEKPYECEVCHAKYTESRYLKKHMRTHTGEKPFNCHICQKTFQERYILNVHMKSHTGEKRWICVICNKACSKSSHLSEHLRTHTGEKPYSCSECGLNFTYKKSLNAHIKVHARTETGYNVDDLKVVIKNEVIDMCGSDYEHCTLETVQNDYEDEQNDFGNQSNMEHGDPLLINVTNSNMLTLENSLIKREPVLNDLEII